MKPSIGKVLHYSLSEKDVEQVNRRRVAGAGHGEEWPAGAQAHVGSPVETGDLFPMMVCVVFEAGTPACTVNGQVLLDGNDSLWVKDVVEGYGPGSCRWPQG